MVVEEKDILLLLNGLIMSCDYGKTKRRKIIWNSNFWITIDSKCIFIDDSIWNVKNFVKVGIMPI